MSKTDKDPEIYIIKDDFDESLEEEEKESEEEEDQEQERSPLWHTLRAAAGAVVLFVIAFGVKEYLNKIDDKE
jgi:hypothetical protein